jgi:hypothetical protein
MTRNNTEKGRLKRVEDWLSEHSFGVSIVVAAGLLLWGYEGYPVPEFSTTIWVAAASFAVSMIVGYPAGKKIIAYLHDPDKVILADISPESGDLAVYEITPEQFQELTVTNQHGERKTVSDLKRIETNRADEAFEVRSYDPINNVATTSWMGGVSQLDLREYRHNLDHVENELSKQADAYLELRSSLKPLVRDSVQKIANWMIATAEGVDVPRGGVIKDSIDTSIDEQGIDDLPTPDEIKLEGERRESDELESLASDSMDSNPGGEEA